MALARIGNARRVENFTWPGFVDALATLLMVIIFVLMVFVLIQVNLAYRVSGQDATLGEMRQQLASLGELLNIERRASADLAANLAQITIQLEAAKSIAKNCKLQLVNVQATIKARMSDIDSLTAKQTDIQAALIAARASLEERLGALQLAEGQLAMAQAQNQSANDKIKILEAETTASKAEVLQLPAALLRLRIEELTGLLAEKDKQASRDKVAIANLGKSLNNALASRVQELQRFRSEFFGRLRDVLKKAGMMWKLSATDLCSNLRFYLPKAKQKLDQTVRNSWPNLPLLWLILPIKYQVILTGCCRLMAIRIMCQSAPVGMLIIGICQPSALCLWCAI